MSDLQEQIVHLVDRAATPLDVHDVMRRGDRRARRARIRNVALGVTVVTLLVTLAIALSAGPSGRVRVATKGSTTTSTPGFGTTVPLKYVDRSKPPPLRIEAGGRSIDASTVLGCWMHANRGICADGVVDPARFQLALDGGRAFTVTSPIDATIQLRWSAPPPGHGPHELPAFPRNAHPLNATRLGARRWRVELPAFSNTIAIYLDLSTATGDRVERGDAYYGFEVRTR